MYKSYYHKGFDGGLNDTASPIEIDRSEASLLQNWDITAQGKLTQRDGLTQVGNTIGANPITGLGAFLRNSGKDLLCIEGTNLRYLNGANWATLQNNLVAGGMFWMENIQVLGKIFFGNEDNTLKSWDRAATTLNTALVEQIESPSHPHGNVYKWHKNHLFTVNNVNVNGLKYPNRIYWSIMGDPATWDTTNQFFEVPGDGRVITIVDLGDNLVVFKERAIQYLSGWGNNSWQVTEASSNVSNIDQQIGCIAPRGAVRVGNEIWFVDNQGQIRRIFQTDFDAFRKDIISKKIQTTLAGLNKTQLSQAVAWFWNNKVYFAFPNGTDIHNSIICVFDIIAASRSQGGESWTTYTGWTPNIFADFYASGFAQMYMGDATTGRVYLHSGPDDNGVAINARWDGKDDAYELIDTWKRYAFGYMNAQTGSGGTIELFASVDQGPFGNIGNLGLVASGSRLGPTGSFRLGPTGDATLGGDAKVQLKYFFDSGGLSPNGKSMIMSIRHNEAGQHASVDTFSVNFKPRQLR